MDFRAIGLILIVVIAIFYYYGFQMVLWAILLGIIVAVIAFLYTLLRAEGEIAKFKKFLRKIWHRYEKLEAKIFKFWDDL